MRGYIYFSLIILTFVSACGQHGGKQGAGDNRPPIVVKAHADRSEVTVGDVVTYSVDVDHEAGMTSEITGKWEEMPGLPVIDMGRNEPKEAGGRTRRSQWWKIRADEVGSYIIPPMTVKYRSSAPGAKDEEFVTPRIFIEVKSVIKEGEQSSDIKDLKPLAEVKRDWTIFYIIAAVLVAAILAGYLIYKKLGSREVVKVDAPPISPCEAAFDALRRLKEKDMIEEGRIRPYYFELSEIFRRYLTGRYNFPADDWTTEEISGHLERSGDCNYDLRHEVLLFLRNTDRVKFAKYVPTAGEPELEFERAWGLVEKTRPVLLEKDAATPIG